MEKILRFLEKYIIPKKIYKFGQPLYHFSLAYLAALFYGFPSKEMTVIGVTGTKGKTTTCNLIAQIFNSAGLKTGMATTANFRIGDKEWKNESKQTMLGRFQLQKLLHQMKNENCKYAVVETSSEGILQYRHQFIDYDIAIFTNLSPEHLERHGGFENYRAAKLKLFEKLAQKKTGIGIYNFDAENVDFFLGPKMWQKYGYTIKNPKSEIRNPKKQTNKDKKINILEIDNIKLSANQTKFTANGEKFEMPLIGKFNIYNAGAAICAAWAQNISSEEIKKGLKSAKAPSGRMEVINEGQNFTLIIDYAHEPASLEAIYNTIAKLKIKNPQSGTSSLRGRQKSKMICLLGAQGGGRDKWKRPKMGEITDQYCDKIILTNEDPYDENPLSIIEDIEKGFSQSANRKASSMPTGRQIEKNYWKIIDRKEAIKKAISLAKKGNAVILTGKGGESWMCVENGKKIPWNEEKIVKEILSK